MENQDLTPPDEEKVEDMWSSLPPDLLSLIPSNLYAGDNAMFRAVCKTWRSITMAPPLPLPSPFDHADSPFPWLFHIPKSNNGRGKFFHPISNYTCEIDLPAQLVGAVIHFSKYGWLLMARHRVHPFLFNPLTKEIIELPELPLDGIEYVRLMFFTSAPSPDCLVVVMNCRPQGHVWILKLGEGEWEFHYIVRENFDWTACNPILHKGLYYSLDCDGNLGVFALEDIDNSWVTYEMKFPWSHFNSIVQAFLVENEGELLAIFIKKNGQKIHVFKLHPTRNIWEPVPSLGDNMLFVSPGASFSKKALVRGTRNKIYGPNFWDKNGLFCFYSLTTAKYHSFFDNLSSKDSYNTKFLQNCSWFISM
ncbi:hypothetical protein QUC31_010212 [Theobroma cacao]